MLIALIALIACAVLPAHTLCNPSFPPRLPSFHNFPIDSDIHPTTRTATELRAGGKELLENLRLSVRHRRRRPFAAPARVSRCTCTWSLEANVNDTNSISTPPALLGPSINNPQAIEHLPVQHRQHGQARYVISQLHSSPGTRLSSVMRGYREVTAL